jgi:hypothetical protein
MALDQLPDFPSYSPNVLEEVFSEVRLLVSILATLVEEGFFTP